MQESTVTIPGLRIIAGLLITGIVAAIANGIITTHNQIKVTNSITALSEKMTFFTEQLIETKVEVGVVEKFVVRLNNNHSKILEKIEDLNKRLEDLENQ